MSKRRNVLEQNPFWKGGRTVASSGYVLVKLPPDHRFFCMADSRGYVYEHRLVIAEKLGRPLRSDEQVHHRDGNKQNNSPENLEHTESHQHHAVKHRIRQDLRLPGEPNPEIQCACGCGAVLSRYDATGRPRAYISGHNPRSVGSGVWRLADER